MVYFFLSVLLVFGVAWVGMDLSTACRQGKGLVCVLYFMFYDYRRSAFIILHFFFFLLIVWWIMGTTSKTRKITLSSPLSDDPSTHNFALFVSHWNDDVSNMKSGPVFVSVFQIA